MEEAANVLRLRANVERPTYEQLKAIGLTIGPNTGGTLSQRPTAFNLRGTGGYFQLEIIRQMAAEKELGDWRHYHNSSSKKG